jgi:hypothetical protein
MYKKFSDYYPFLDVVLDVLYSIILYDAFTAFPGFNLAGVLFVFAVFIMVNYWWSSRNFEEFHKHYLIDFYVVTIVMFIVMQWPKYYNDINSFVMVLAAFFFTLAIGSIISLFTHEEKDESKALKTYIMTDGALSIYYTLMIFLIKDASIPSLILIIAPYLIKYLYTIRKGIFRTKFTGADKQPY